MYDRPLLWKTPRAQALSVLGALPLLWAAAVAAALFAQLGGWGFDDPYITYRYAENLAAGQGFVYNPGERVLSTTTPFYTLLLALVRLLGFELPAASNAIGCASLALGGLALWQFGQLWNTPIAGAVGLLFYPLSPLLLPTLGAETALYVALALFGLLAYGRERYVWSAALLGAAALTRSDGVLAAAVAGLHFLAVRRGRPPWRAIALYLAILVAWHGFAWAYFGAPLPVTLAAKQRQGAMTQSQSFGAGLLRQLESFWGSPFRRYQLVLAAAGAVYCLARARRWLLVVGWNALYVAAYVALGVSSYFWYYGPIAAGLVGLSGLGVAGAAAIAGRFGRRWAWAITALLLAALVFPQGIILARLGAASDNRLAIYREVGTWLARSTPEDASVGTLEVGIIGFYAGRRMVDFAGLIQPEVARQIGPASTYDDTALWAFRRFEPDYLVLREPVAPTLARDEAFQRRCRVAATFEDERFPATLAAYDCTSDQQ